VSPTEPARVRYKDLCLDAVDAPALAAFWGPTLGLDVRTRDDGVVVLGDGVDTHTVWVNPVPEPRTTENRLQLEVRGAAVEDLVRRGAVLLEDPDQGVPAGVTVLADPDGGRFRAVVPELADSQPAEPPPAEPLPTDRLPPSRLHGLVLAADEPERLAHWWADRLGGTATSVPGGGAWRVEGAEGLPGRLLLEQAPEPGRTKNRVHVDVWGETAEVLAAGATLLRARDAEIRWDVLADPEGNVFCVFAPAPRPARQPGRS